MKKLRVAFVAPSLGILGGQAVQADRLLNAWRDDPEIEAWLVPVNPQLPFGLRWAAKVKYARTFATQLVYLPTLVRELARADVAHVFSASYSSFLLAPLPAVLVARAWGRPVVMNYRSGQAPDHLKRSSIARRTLARVHNIVPSRFLVDVFRSFGIGARSIPNVVDVDRFRYRERSPLGARLLSTRNFAPLYNVACTIRAFARIQARRPDATLTLVGQGTEERALRALVSDLGLHGVVFAGAVAPDAIAGFYADADIYIQSPDIDNMPTSILEAYASGLPVVSTDAGGIPAILASGEQGLLAPVDDDERLAALVLELLDDPERARRIAANGRRACDAYQWTVVRDQWLREYRAARSASPAHASSLASRVAKLTHLGPSEVIWRGQEKARTAIDRVRHGFAPRRWERGELLERLIETPRLHAARSALADGRWDAAHAELSTYFAQAPASFVLSPADRPSLAARIQDVDPDAPRDARRRADAILDGRYDLLGYRDLRFGTGAMPDWHLDPVHERRAPRAFWSSVPYLDPRIGDHKIIWELNRHQHWLTLGRAWWLTGQPEYRARMIAELRSWMIENPPLAGVNWASMLELAFRCLSWTWALQLFVDARLEPRATADSNPWTVDLLLALDTQLAHVERHLSYYFSPNTHLLGEALALYVCGRAIPELRDSERRAATGRRILEDEATRQIAGDGGHCERATQYHRYALDFYLLALAVARVTGDPAERVFERAGTRLADAASVLADDHGRLPHIGDDDGGRLLPWTRQSPHDAGDSLSMASVLLARPDLAVGPIGEEAIWMSRAWSPASPDAAFRPRVVASRALADTGYYVSRSTSGGHIVIDGGAHGYQNGGHAHADSLSMTLTVRGRPLLIDPGTACYTTDARMRDRFRSTALHNTVVVDGRPQSLPRGPFHWQTTADGRADRWQTTADYDYFEGTHDGYAPLVHRRHLFVMHDDLVVVADLIAGDGTHSAEAHWHIDPSWTLETDGARVTLAADAERLQFVAPLGRVERLRGDAESGLGWRSPIYGSVEPIDAIRITRTERAPFWIVSVFGLDPANAVTAAQILPVWSEAGALSHSLAVLVPRERSRDLVTIAHPAASGAPFRWRVGDVDGDAHLVFRRWQAGELTRLEA